MHDFTAIKLIDGDDVLLDEVMVFLELLGNKRKAVTSYGTNIVW